MNLKWGNIK